MNFSDLPPCHSRREWPSEDQAFCSHPNVVVANQLVTRAICRICTRPQDPPPVAFRATPTQIAARKSQACVHLGDLKELKDCSTCRGNVRIKIYNCHHVSHTTTTARDCLTCIDHEGRLPKGGVRKWAVGVTTAPRVESTLARTLCSLKKAGWTEVRLFAEQGSLVPPDFTGELTIRSPPLGAWSNWFSALSELYHRVPNADAYLLAQDDVVFTRGVRNYLESVLWPAENTGVVSIYSSASYQQQSLGLVAIRHSVGLIGALALVFPPSAVRSLLCDPYAIRHCLDPTNGQRDIDQVVAHWSVRHGTPTFAHSPSLAQHIGSTSTVWRGATSAGHRRACDFPGEEYDARGLIEKNKQIKLDGW